VKHVVRRVDLLLSAIYEGDAKSTPNILLPPTHNLLWWYVAWLATGRTLVLLVLIPELFGACLADRVVPFFNCSRHEVGINHDRVPCTAMVVARVKEGTRFVVVCHEH